MRNNIFRVEILVSAIICILIFSSCSVETEVGVNTSSREYVKEACSSIGFGKGVMDDEVVVLDYVYKDEVLKEKYGDSFEVKDIGGNVEMGTNFFGIYKGAGKYGVTINGDEWTAEVNKSFFGKWEVTNCYSGWEVS